MTNQTDMIKEAIRDTNGNLSMVSRVLGLDYHALKKRFPAVERVLISTSEPEPADISTLGRKGFEQYVIAVKPAGSGWPDKYHTVIAEARKGFDNGTHEMFQTTENGWVVQYLIPYLVPVERRSFFATMIVMK